MAREILSLGMFSALAAAMAERRRGLPSGSPPPALAATMISLIRRVKILPRLASSAPFLCLMVAHFEWPDMLKPRTENLVLQAPDGQLKPLNEAFASFVILSRRAWHGFDRRDPRARDPT